MLISKNKKPATDEVAGFFIYITGENLAYKVFISQYLVFYFLSRKARFNSCTFLRILIRVRPSNNYKAEAGAGTGIGPGSVPGVFVMSAVTASL